MLSQIAVYLLKMSLSIFLGSIIGLERDKQNKPAGFRDAILVILGATLLTLVTFEVQKITSNFDFARILGYTVASVGFLGSGLIMRHNNKLEGITTASLLFSLLAIGFFIGLGSYILAVLSTIAIYFILVLKKFKIKIERKVQKCRKRKSKLLKKK